MLCFTTSVRLSFYLLTPSIATNHTSKKSPPSAITWQIAYENQLTEAQATEALAYLLESMGAFEDAMESLSFSNDDLLQKPESVTMIGL